MTTNTTWDGIPIATGAPQGSTIVVRRRTGHGWQYPILHRTTNGPEHNGHWAWTPPSGMRQPGEGALAAAIRELAEETGLTDTTIHPVDLARGHALWTATVGDQHDITLDHEHDRYEWLDATQATQRCRPGLVAEGIATVEAIPDTDFTFTPRNNTHDITADEQTWGTINHHRATGTAWEPILGDPGAVIIDHTPTQPATPRHDLIPRLAWTYLRDIITKAHPDLTNVWTAIDPHDTPTLRAWAKAGFTHDATTELQPARPKALCALRVRSWWGLTRQGTRAPRTSRHRP